jgi:hypothetical protein
MGFQFFHAYCFSSGGKHQAAGAIGEACRDPEFSAHVKDPKPPEWVCGSRELIEAAVREYQEKWRDSRGHKLRIDGQVLRADVVAWPADMTPEGRKKGQELTIAYYREKFGPAFRGALIHTDEPFKDEGLRDKPREHLHLFIVPEAAQRFDDLHAGLKAKRAADQINRKASKEEKSEAKAHGSEAYRDAMKAEQDDFFQQVGRPLGLERKDLNSPRERISKQKQTILNRAKDHAIENIENAQGKAEKIEAEALEIAKSIKADAERAAAGIRASAEKERAELDKREKAQHEREKEFFRGRDEGLKKWKMPDLDKNEYKKIPLIGDVFLASYFDRVQSWAAGLVQRVQKLIADNKQQGKDLEEEKTRTESLNKSMSLALARLDGKYGEEKEFGEWKRQRDAERHTTNKSKGRGR